MRLKNILPLMALLWMGFTRPSCPPMVMTMEMELMESGWDRHFVKTEHNHLDFGKFKTIETGDVYLIQFFSMGDFNTRKLRKHAQFEIDVTYLGDAASLSDGIGIKLRHKKDLERYPLRMMMGIRELQD